MGAWIARAGILVGLLVAAPAMAFHEDIPLQHAQTLDRAGWFGARFTPTGPDLTIVTSAYVAGSAFQQIIIFDDQDAVLGAFQVFREDFATYARASAAGVHREVRAPPPLGGGGASWGGSPLPCRAGYATGSSSTGHVVIFLELPAVCDGRPVRGAIASTTGNAAGDLRLELRAAAPIDVVSQSSTVGGVFLDASRFDGVSVELSTGAQLIPSAGFADASTRINVVESLYGVYAPLPSIAPSVAPPALSYVHGADAGACPCSWTGGTETLGEWGFALDGVRDSRVYLTYVDAELPD